MINPDAIPRIDGDMVAEVTRKRGGGAKRVGELQSGYGELTLGEVARRAVAGDQDAEKR